MDSKITRAIMACLFTALISVGAYIAIPIPGTPVPIVLQNMFILLAGMVLGPRWGLVSVALYLLLGAAGLPVFSGGTGGLAKFAGPTGGYLIGYIPAVIAAGLISRFGKRAWYWNALAGLTAMAIVYLFGVVRLRMVLNATWAKALAAGFFPFLLGDAIKIAIASGLTPALVKGIQMLDSPDHHA